VRPILRRTSCAATHHPTRGCRFCNGSEKFPLDRWNQHKFKSLTWHEIAPLRRIHGGSKMNGIIYLIGLVVVVMAILSFVGLR
jgi:hypothetical protein